MLRAEDLDGPADNEVVVGAAQRGRARVKGDRQLGQRADLAASHPLATPAITCASRPCTSLRRHRAG